VLSGIGKKIDGKMIRKEEKKKRKSNSREVDRGEERTGRGEITGKSAGTPIFANRH
jgi:hypothetical protein